MNAHARQRTQATGPVLRTSAAVLLAHAGVLWLVIHHLASPQLTGSNAQVILASVVAEMPAPETTQAAPQPARVRAPTPLPPQHPAVQQTAATTARAAPSELAPTTNAPPAATVAPTSASAAAASARPAPAAAASLVLPSSDADYLNNPPPAYPRMSRRMGEQGTVLVRVFISTEGRAEKAEIRTSSGYARLDEAALETVQRWRFVPGKRAGQPEAMWFNVPIRFVLD